MKLIGTITVVRSTSNTWRDEYWVCWHWICQNPSSIGLVLFLIKRLINNFRVLNPSSTSVWSLLESITQPKGARRQSSIFQYNKNYHSLFSRLGFHVLLCKKIKFTQKKIKTKHKKIKTKIELVNLIFLVASCSFWWDRPSFHILDGKLDLYRPINKWIPFADFYSICNGIFTTLIICNSYVMSDLFFS